MKLGIPASRVFLFFTLAMPPALTQAGYIGEPWSKVAAGWSHNLGLREDGSIVAWGYNANGQTNVPAPNTAFTNMVGGRSHSLGLKNDGTIVAWGWNAYGQTDLPTPNANFIGVAAGYGHSLALSSNSSVVAWGYNVYGQTNAPSPNSGFSRIAAGNYHNLALRTNGSIAAWGDNSYAQTNVPSPNANFTAISAGSYHSLALNTGGSVVAWGDNSYGQTNLPSTNVNFTAIAAGGNHSLALRANGTVVAWGDNTYGQATAPSPNSNFVAIVAGLSHSLAIRSDGVIVTWGRNDKGQTDVPAVLRSGVIPGTGYVAGAYTVTISGKNLGNGSDITSVSLCGVNATTINSQSATQVVVTAAAAPGAITGEVRVVSSSQGQTIKTNSFVYIRSPQTISFPASVARPATSTVTLVATASSGLPVSFLVQSGPGLITSSSNLTFSGYGTVSIVAYQAGNGSFEAAPDVTNSITVCDVIPNIGPFAGGNTVMITSDHLGNGSDITSVLVGGIAASVTDQTTNQVTVTMPSTLSAGLKDIVIQSDSIGASLLEKSYTYNPAGSIISNGVTPSTGMVNGGYVVTIKGSNLGTGSDITSVTLAGIPAAISNQSATQVVVIAGFANNTATGDVVVTSISYGTTVITNGFTYIKAFQNITFPAITNQEASNVVTVLATSDSTLPVSFMVISGPGSVASSNLSFTGPGIVTLVATQSGNYGFYTANATNTVNVYDLSTDNGPQVGSNTVVYTHWQSLGSGSDITNVQVGGVAATILGQTANSVTLRMPPASYPGRKNIDISSTSLGTVSLYKAYNYNPSGFVGRRWIKFSSGYANGSALRGDGSIHGWGFSSGSPPGPNTNFVDVASGDFHTLGLKRDGSVVCWGGNGSGEGNVPAPNSNFISIAAGRFCSIGLKSDGSIVMWGSGATQTTNQDYVAVAAGRTSAGAQFSGTFYGLTTGGTIRAWGPNWYGELSVPEPNSNFIAVAAGDSFAVGLKSDGTVVKWGGSWMGDLPAPGTNFIAISAKVNTYMGLRGDGSIDNWRYGGTIGAPAINEGYTAASIGADHVLAQRPDDTLVAWGSNSDGQTNVPTSDLYGGVEPIGGSITGGLVTISGRFLGNGSDITNVTLCGSNATIISQSRTQIVVRTSTFGPGTTTGDVHIASTSHGVTIKSNGFSYIRLPQAITFPPIGLQRLDATVGLAASSDSGLPVGFGLASGFAAIANVSNLTFIGPGIVGIVATQGGNFAYAAADPVTNYFQVYSISSAAGSMTGSNSVTVTAGRLGNGTDITNVLIGTTPAPITAQSSNWVTFLMPASTEPGLMNISILSTSVGTNILVDAYRYNTPGFIGLSWTALAAGKDYSLALKNNGAIYAWGSNAYGQCTVSPPNNDFMAIAAHYHTLAVRTNGALAAWGYNNNGQATVPTTNQEFKAVAAGLWHSVALRTNGSLLVWGSGGYGQTNLPLPNTDFVAIAAGDYHSVALKADGRVAAWGYNAYQQTNSPSPNSGFTAVAAGALHTLALKATGSVLGWGDNPYGQCTVPAPNADFIAIAAGTVHSIGLKSNGVIVAWGDNTYGQCNIPAPNTNFVAIAAGGHHNIALKSDGTLVSWGRNHAGQTNAPITDFPVAPITGSAAGGFTVNITGWDLGSGSDITNVTLCDAVASIQSQSSTQVIVTAGAAVGVLTGDVRVVSIRSGASVLSNIFTYVKLNQTIAFPAVGQQNQTNTVGLAGTASSGLNLQFDVLSGPGVVSGGSNLTFTSVGTVTVVGSQPGSHVYNPCPSNITNTIIVTLGITTNVGPFTGGNNTTLSFWQNLGSGNDITNVLVGGVSATIVAQGANWVTITIPVATKPGLSDIVVVSTSVGATSFPRVYRFNPPAEIGYRWTAIAGAQRESMALRNDGSVFAWGDGYNGQWNAPGEFISIRGKDNNGSYTSTRRGMGVTRDGDIYEDSILIANGPGYIDTARSILSVFALKNDGTVDRFYSSLIPYPPANSNFIAIAGGYRSFIGLLPDSSVSAWGWNEYGFYNLPNPNTNFVAVAAGLFSAYALRSDGSIAVWGDNYYGEGIAPATNTNFVAVAAWSEHVLGLKNDSSIVAWGKYHQGQCNIPTNTPNTNWTDIACGANHSIGVKSDGSIYVWGDAGNQAAKPVLPTTSVSPTNAPVIGGATVTIFGSNLGNGNDVTNVTLCGIQATIISQTPTQLVVNAGDATGVMTGDVVVVSTSAGYAIKSNIFSYTVFDQAITFPPITNQDMNATVALTATSSSRIQVSYAIASGPGVLSTNGTNATLSFSAPGVVRIVASQAGNIGYTPAASITNTVYVYDLSAPSGPRVGSNTVTYTHWDMLGTGTDITNVTIGGVVAQILDQSFDYVTFVIPAAAEAGQQNIVITSTSFGSFTLLNGYRYNPTGFIGTRWKAFDLGFGHGMALRGDNTIQCWGANAFGVCDVPAPNSNFVAVAAGFWHSLALKADGSLVTWGDNGQGQLNLPQQNAGFVAIDAGGYSSVALRYDGQVFTWGEGAQQVTNRDFVAVRVSTHDGGGNSGVHFFGIRADKSVVGWGANSHGQLNVPGTNADFSDIVCGQNYTLGLKTDGTIVSWGENDNLQMNVPSPNSGFMGINCHGDTSLGLRTNGSVFFWGYENGSHSPNPGFVEAKVGYGFGVGIKDDTTLSSWGWVNFDGQQNLPAASLYGGVEPPSGAALSTVVISGRHLGNGSDITNVTLCGVNSTLISQNSSQIVVTAGAAQTITTGDVVVVSTSYGTTIQSNAFIYTAIGQLYSLTIQAGPGAETPVPGSYTNVPGVTLTNFITLPATGTGTQYLFGGWTMIGHAPSSGAGTNFTMTLTNNAVLTWSFTTNYWLSVSAGSDGLVSATNGWRQSGSVTQITAMASSNYQFTYWSGDISGAAAYSNPLALLVSGPTTLTANFLPLATTNGIPYLWLIAHGFTGNFDMVALQDPNNNGYSTEEDYILGLDPTNPLSVATPVVGLDGNNGFVYSWPSASGRLYTVWTASNILGTWSIIPGMSNLPATPPMNTVTNPITGRKLYRFRARIAP